MNEGIKWIYKLLLKYSGYVIHRSDEAYYGLYGDKIRITRKYVIYAGNGMEIEVLFDNYGVNSYSINMAMEYKPIYALGNYEPVEMIPTSRMIYK